MNTDQAKTLIEAALMRLMEALEQGHSEALKQYLDTATDSTGAGGRRQTRCRFVGVIRIAVYLGLVGKYYKMVQHGDASP